MSAQSEHGALRGRISPGPRAILAAAALLLAAGLSTRWRIQPDSALYLGIARSIAAGEGYTFSGDAQYSIPPVAPVLFSLVWKAAGTPEAPEGVERLSIWFNLLCALAALGGVGAAYLLVREISGRPAALFAAGLVAVSHRYYAVAMVPLTDTLFCLVSWTALLAFVRVRGGAPRRRIAAAAVLAALAPLTRAVGAALVGALAVRAAWRAITRRARVADAVIAAPGVVTAAAFAAVVLMSRGGAGFNYWDDLVAGRGAGELVARFGYDLWTLPGNVFEAIVGFESFGGFSYLFAAWFVWGAVAVWRRGRRVVVFYCGVYLLWVALGEEVRPRYVTPALPLIFCFMFEAAGLTAAQFARKSAAAARRSRAVLTVLAAVVVTANLIHIGDEIRLSRSDDFYKSYHHGKWADYRDLGAYIAEEPPAGRVLALHHRVLHMLSGVPTTPLPYHPETARRPSNEEIARYVEDRAVTAIVTDGDEAESASILTDFIKSRGGLWLFEAGFGRLLLYRRENNAGAPAR